ncbi:Nephrocystin-3 [Colletotrichum aenigma]|uniref:Nephrocystin-3 n=1 Tax=Colletotrichum aenigma TaxID=1215731 RepID=UPI0018733ED2|nr:Nephrocystin-3 [Colletotrichum aenigma]KAF5521162.1 Nephrocystin-3 [Colletotrichum aenigma]
MAQKWRHDDYKVAWIFPLEVEQIAALEMLDDEHPALPKSPADHNVYSLGSINGHNIVVAGLYQPGNCPAATVVAQMRMTFPNLRFGLLVGIGGGVPVETDNGMIRLGHVVVSKPTAGHSGALQYDHGKARDGQFQRIGALAPPPAVLLNAAQDLEAKRARRDIDPVQQNVRRIDTRRRGLRRFQYPGAENDYLYAPHYAHIAQGAPCAAGCEPSKCIPRASDDDETQTISAHPYNLSFKLQGVNSVNNFVARRAELGRLHEALKWTVNRRIVVLYGLGGMGKTQTTIAYAKKYRHDYSAVIWLDASNATALKQSYQRVARQIASEIPSIFNFQKAVHSRDLDEAMGIVKRWLDERENNRWLMIYDNYDDVDFRTRDNSKQTAQDAVMGNEDDAGGPASKAYDIRPYFPDTEHGAIFITTRSSSVGRLGRSIQLGKLVDIEDCLNILTSTSGRVDFANDRDARLLAQKLDGLPLALATAGAYLNQVSTSCTEYVQMYEKMWLRLHEESPHLLEYDRALYSTWNVTLRHIQLQNQHAVELLRLWAYFDNHDLWYELLQAGEREKKPVWLHELTKDKLSFDAAMRVVCEYGLAETNTYDHQGLSSGSRGYNVEDSPSVFRKLARLYRGQGRITEAESMLEQALRCLDKRSRPDHILSISRVFHMFGDLYFDQGRLNDAKAMYERALQRRKKALGLHHKETIATINGLGLCYNSQGQMGDAQAMLEQAVQSSEKALGPDHRDTLTAVHNLGIVYAQRGQLEDANMMYKRAFEGREKVLGPYHPQTLWAVSSISSIYLERGQLEDAKIMCERALQGLEKALGPGHPKILSTIYYLAEILKDQSQLKDAKLMCERILREYDTMLEPGVLKTYVPALRTLQALACLFEKKGEAFEAISCYQQAQNGFLIVFGPDDERYISICGQISSFRSSMEELIMPPGADQAQCREVDQ